MIGGKRTVQEVELANVATGLGEQVHGCGGKKNPMNLARSGLGGQVRAHAVSTNVERKALHTCI